MGELKLVLCGDKWPAQEKLGSNLILKVPADKPIEDNSVAIRQLLKEDSLAKYDFHKGKGKPPNVLPGAKINLQKTPKEVGDKGGLVVLYVKEKEKKGTDSVKLLLCGDEWKAHAKLTENIMVVCKRNQSLETVLPELLKALNLKSLDGYTLCKGRGKTPDVTPGATIALSRTPDSLNLTGAALVYVKKDEAGAKDEPKQEHRTIYQLGAKVEVLDSEGGNEWLPGSITCIHEDGTYDVAYDSGNKDRYVEADDIRPGKEPEKKPAAAPAKVSVEHQRAALKELVEAFPNKSVPEIGGVLKSKNFDIEEARKLLKATEPEPEKPKPKKVVEPFKPQKFMIKLNSPSESLGLEFHAISNKVFIDGVVPDLPFARAKVPVNCVLVTMNNVEVRDKTGILNVLTEIRKEEYSQFDIEVDTRPESQIWLYAPVDVCFDREWEKGMVVSLNDDGTFDVKIAEDGEIEHSVDYSDIRIREGDIKEVGEMPGMQDAPPAVPPATMPDHEGIVKKQGADVVGLYKMRRFALYGSALYYFHPNKPKPIGVLDLREALVMSDVSKGRDWFAIGGKRLDRVYNFIAGSPEEKDDWLVAFQEAGCKVVRKGED
eukprot:TRINITY_DN2350_c0_g2_i1.p1 TRINITY_DN2350_c0_g2~~TRINITY_DN2350_c0_g2_i1.p1  ORF type:complete len:612 (+),score=265.91 TRINITY_DN2350_c0_g2_i1:36-1838(+)